MIYLFFILSALFGALTQLVRFEQGYQSWLPAIVFEWDLTHLWSTLDAYHIYQGIWLICFGIAFYLLGRISLTYPSSILLKFHLQVYRFLMWGYKKFGELWEWMIVVGIIILYYQVYNLFYHIVFRYPEFWRWPFG